jgi:hypothetical protein
MGQRPSNGGEKPANARNTGFSLFFSCVTDFSLSACAVCIFFNGARLRSSLFLSVRLADDEKRSSAPRNGGQSVAALVAKLMF